MELSWFFLEDPASSWLVIEIFPFLPVAGGKFSPPYSSTTGLTVC